MIVTERYINEHDGREFIRTYSDRGMLIHGGVPESDYIEAVDPVERIYTETNIPIDQENTENEAEAILRILMGGAV